MAVQVLTREVGWYDANPVLSLEFLYISKIIPKSSWLAIIAKISLEAILIDSSKFKISENILSLKT